MAVAPNQKKLIIPGKTDPSAPLYYARDMRTIEMWANAQQGGGGITEITTGTPSVLTITDPTGPVVNIDSTGGGGTGFGSIEINAGMDSAEDPPLGGGGSVFLGPAPEGAPVAPLLVPILDTTSLVGGAAFHYATSWIIFPFAGASVCILPTLTAPAYTFGAHGPINFRCVLNAWSFDSTNVFSAFTTALTALAPSTSVQSAIGDYTVDDTFGADLTFTAGTGTTGNGVVSAGGLSNAYFGSVQFSFNVPEGVTF